MATHWKPNIEIWQFLWFCSLTFHDENLPKSLHSQMFYFLFHLLAKFHQLKKGYANRNVYWMNKYVGDVCWISWQFKYDMYYNFIFSCFWWWKPFKIHSFFSFLIFYFTLWQIFINKEMFLPTIMYLLHRYVGALFFGKIFTNQKKIVDNKKMCLLGGWVGR
jgi:hypothetical protein